MSWPTHSETTECVEESRRPVALQRVGALSSSLVYIGPGAHLSEWYIKTCHIVSLLSTKMRMSMRGRECESVE